MKERLEKPLVWVGSTKRDLLKLPRAVRRVFGFALSEAQCGGRHKSAWALQGFGSAGVLEVIEDDEGGTYRAVYTVKFKVAVFALHVFQKKSKSGIATPKAEIDLIHERLRFAERIAKEMDNE